MWSDSWAYILYFYNKGIVLKNRIPLTFGTGVSSIAKKKNKTANTLTSCTKMTDFLRDQNVIEKKVDFVENIIKLIGLMFRLVSECSVEILFLSFLTLLFPISWKQEM